MDFREQPNTHFDPIYFEMKKLVDNYTMLKLLACDPC